MDDWQQLPRIPTPFRQRFREFRIRVFPVAVFGVIVFGVFELWQRLDFGGMPGIAEGSVFTVTSPRIGLVADLNVEPFQWVQAGTVLATIYPDDPRSQLDLLHIGLDMARLQFVPSLADQNAINYERLRIAASVQETDLALAKVNLERAEPALKRNEQLLKDHLISQDVYEASLRDRDFYRSEIAERTKALKDIEKQLQALGVFGQTEALGTNVAMVRLLSEMRTNFVNAASNLNPLKLVAPISGMVRTVLWHNGEYVAAGVPLITMESDHCERIVAYLRQPSRFRPKVGMHVTVKTRSLPSEKFEAEISHIGAHMESITNALVMHPVGTVVLGLPIDVSVPQKANIHPGEIVDVVLDPSAFRLFGNDPSRLPAKSLASHTP